MKSMNITKIAFALLVSLAMLAVVFSPKGAVAMGDFTDPSVDSPIVRTYDLYAGQDILVGQLIVEMTNGQISLQYDILEGWFLKETHAEVATDLMGIWQSKGNPVPGKFSEGHDFSMKKMVDGDVVIFQGSYSLPLLVAAHASVFQMSDGHVVNCETAWAAYSDGTGEQFPGNNWATYVIFPDER